MKPASIEKLPAGSRFIDLSDYARPLAMRLVRFLVPHTLVTPNVVTFGAGAVGLVSAVLIWNGTWLWLAALLLPVKSLLDAADGSLARARSRPSQVGRFFDSFCDYIVHLALFLAIAQHTGQSAGYAALAFLLSIFQVSVCNYYYVIKRHASAGDSVSEVDQRSMPTPFPWDNPAALRFLHASYLVMYWWQDRLVCFLDPEAMASGARLSNGFMTALSLLAMGFQLLMICVLIGTGLAASIFFYFTIPATFYALALIVYRRFVAARIFDTKQPTVVISNDGS